ncbi:hypothetical protein [Singulisphaera acidiphila]|uniref:Uncharacterized protein n=1 Tax=Singulisphaera acidiphila (strain ATCC BAA-1392 / DSM 18658 / VKM B-2454 / MOB10) TaxID=886293 RepID=L0DK49_SINAD|nr:hypothetical protein [Singulisphaera acidiphila]AGA29632.1 hypothetical protein Sinac_5488 [Singulisphaera acidiphila DSM 18658]
MHSRHLSSRRFFIQAATTSLGVSLLAIAGCGGPQNTETVVPEIPPEQAAKDSMDYYKKNVAGKKKSVR